MRSRNPVGEERRSRWDTAFNGSTIEENMIFTTHNLNAIISELKSELKADKFDLPYISLAWKCFVSTITQANQQNVDRNKENGGSDYSLRKACIVLNKNSAYAWRNMVFFLAEA